MTGRNYLKTTILLAAMSGLLLFVGQVLGGGRWLTIMLIVAIAMNGLSYFFSDKIALRAARARPVSEAEFPELYQVVQGLAVKANIPMPRLYVSPSPQPNAFATGRNPNHAAVAVTQGILPILDRRELEGVLAHELSHVRNRDILISSVAATIAAVITWLAHLAFFLPIGSDDDEGGNPLAGLLLLILAPIAAALIQLAVTRSREFGADDSGARITADPLALASALRKIEAFSRGTPPATTNEATAHLFISNPFKSGGGAAMARLFSTHPPTSERVARLEAMAYDPRRL
ncbi:MAG TPA: zinc metalloprotease HtpX [Actinomycetota bacterium]|jgi:heat shock protein HtpX|nr:zinc metalloprotease HtpX [Actinomycetota bacterium]